MSGGILLDLMDFRTGAEASTCHMPLTITIRMGRDMDIGGSTVEIG
jgi:hypothetical protein